MHFINKHFKELKIILAFSIISFCWSIFCCSINYYILLYLIAFPFVNLDLMLQNTKDFICTNLYEIVFTYFFVILFFSLYFNFSLLIYFLFVYIKSGLFKFEICILKNVYKIFVLNLFLSNTVTYFVILPAIISVFFQLNNNLTLITIQIQAKILSYVKVVIVLFFVFNIVFQLPLLLLLCQKLFDINWFYKNRRLIVVFDLIFGCIFSSPDVLMQIFIALFLFFYTECFIFFLFLKKQYNLITYF